MVALKSLQTLRYSIYTYVVLSWECTTTYLWDGLVFSFSGIWYFVVVISHSFLKVTFHVQVSFFEIYKEKIYDLLASTTHKNRSKVCTLYRGRQKDALPLLPLPSPPALPPPPLLPLPPPPPSFGSGNTLSLDHTLRTSQRKQSLAANNPFQKCFHTVFMCMYNYSTELGVLR